MSASRTARERARAELTQEIKDEARRQLAAGGAHGLSLRAVARELGMVSSALYRYFASRDDLLTALIIDAYDALGDRVETADQALPATEFRARWHTCCTTIRTWAIEHPHEYALVYGSPVPGYAAPESTIAPASRIPAAVLGIVRDAWLANALAIRDTGPPLPAILDEQAARIAERVAPGVPSPVILRGTVAWTQLFGAITFELFGHLANTLDPADAFFDHTATRMADLIGLPQNPSRG